MSRITTPILLLLFKILLFASCAKAPRNGDLDGLWQLHTIQYADGTIEEPFVYLSFHNELVHYQGYDLWDHGLFDYRGDSIDLKVINREEALTGQFGIYGNTQTFYIKHLNKRGMVLTTPLAEYRYRKW